MNRIDRKKVTVKQFSTINTLATTNLKAWFDLMRKVRLF